MGELVKRTSKIVNQNLKIKLFFFLMLGALNTSFAVHVFEVVEVTFTGSNNYDNPYLEVNFDVTLTGPGGTYQVPAFWDGGDIWRARLVATAPGTWNWSTGSSQTRDGGLNNKSGSFTAEPWTEAEKQANPNRRGFVRVSANKRTLEYSDGTPYFLIGDTWWSAFTRTYLWDSSGGVSRISFQDAVALRKAQGFNSINTIATFPSDNIQGKGIWHPDTHGEKVAENGTTPFKINGDDCDYLRLQPEYFRQADRKWEHLWDNGFVVFMESVRRSEAWPEQSSVEKDAFVNYTRYLWARWGCYNMIYSWLHMDADQNKGNWSNMIVKCINSLGDMPYGQPRTAMCPGSGSHEYWDDRIQPGLDVHNISNKNARQHDTAFPELREIFNQTNIKPGYNIEGFYPQFLSDPQGGMSIDEYAMFMVYGCVLNGGLVGHVWGDAYWGGTHYKDGDPHKNGFNRWNAQLMKHVHAFFTDPDHDYRILKPATITHLADSYSQYIALSVSQDEKTALGFVAVNESGSSITLKNMPASTTYKFAWWNINNGGWQDQSALTSSEDGNIILPGTPDKNKNWAFRLIAIE